MNEALLYIVGILSFVFLVYITHDLAKPNKK